MVIALFVVIGFVLILLLWILLMPAYFILDTSQAKYEMHQLGVFKMAYCPGHPAVFKLNILGISIRMPSMDGHAPKARKEGSPQPNKSLDAWLYLQRGLRSSFQLKRCQCAIDTDDPVLNAQLYSILPLLNRKHVSVTINFLGENCLSLEVKAKVYRLCWTIIRFLTKK